MDLPKFREKLKEYRNRIGLSQEALADAIYVNKGVLSEILNGKRIFPPGLVHSIVQFLAKQEAILGQSQAYELLKLTDTEDFSGAEWDAPPLANLAPPPSTAQSSQRKKPSVSTGKAFASASVAEEKSQDDESLVDVSVQQIKTSEEAELLHNQIQGDLRVTLIQLPGLQQLYLSPKNRLEAAYRQLMIISETRFQFAGTIEALRKTNSLTAHESLPQVKEVLDEAEMAFHEDEVRQTLLLLDNHKVWPHYILGTAAFENYKGRTNDLVEMALKPRSPRMHIVVNWRALLDDHWKDDDPQTRKLYEEMGREFNAMLKAMNRRLRL